MTKKAYRKMVIGYLQWSVIGLVIALVTVFVNSDYRTVVYGVPVTKASMTEALGVPASLPYTAPASAAKEAKKRGVDTTVPDTINGELVWPDPWGAIKSSSGADY